MKGSARLFTGSKGVTPRLSTRGTRNSNVQVWAYLFLIVLLVKIRLSLRSDRRSDIWVTGNMAACCGANDLYNDIAARGHIDDGVTGARFATHNHHNHLVTHSKSVSGLHSFSRLLTHETYRAVTTNCLLSRCHLTI